MHQALYFVAVAASGSIAQHLTNIVAPIAAVTIHPRQHFVAIADIPSQRRWTAIRKSEAPAN